MGTDLQPFDPRLVTLIAAGVGDPFDLAAECGIPASEFVVLQETPAFKAALERARTELEDEGFTPEYAELVLLQEALPVMVKGLIARYNHANTTLDQQLKIAELSEKLLQARRNRVSPKRQQQEQVGSGFSIIFNWPENLAQLLSQATIDAEAREVHEPRAVDAK